MENDAEQLKNRFMGASRPGSLSSDFAHRQCETYQRPEMDLVGTQLINTSDSQGVILTADDKDENIKSNTYHGDGSTTTEGHLVAANAGDSQAVISSNVVKGPYGQSQPRDPYRDDGSTSVGAIITVVKSKAGKGVTHQRTDVGSLDSESDTCHYDGSTASSAVLGPSPMDRSTTVVACLNSEGSQAGEDSAAVESLQFVQCFFGDY